MGAAPPGGGGLKFWTRCNCGWGQNILDASLRRGQKRIFPNSGGHLHHGLEFLNVREKNYMCFKSIVVIFLFFEFSGGQKNLDVLRRGQNLLDIQFGLVEKWGRNFLDVSPKG